MRTKQLVVVGFLFSLLLLVDSHTTESISDHEENANAKAVTVKDHKQINRGRRSGSGQNRGRRSCDPLFQYLFGICGRWPFPTTPSPDNPFLPFQPPRQPPRPRPRPPPLAPSPPPPRAPSRPRPRPRPTPPPLVPSPPPPPPTPLVPSPPPPSPPPIFIFPSPPPPVLAFPPPLVPSPPPPLWLPPPVFTLPPPLDEFPPMPPIIWVPPLDVPGQSSPAEDFDLITP
ncbi:hypothetical protein BRARA_I04908 [Brassica rapa]|uniref:Uncharacterized protein n=2 Tax=Brassica TaxID=3705 RepID=A0A397YCK6_BRACM|nr:hypothetical protein BRARA_I04908 [Brassica rapa]CAF2050526.1 unnamed protein product [Brassica napus]CAG7866911.1 unnamed protein product [Brassica rapa]CDY52863.1 BnaA09g56550D [Brassica napus]VDC63876.1 unnamed protein product [Brassica rapa]